MNSFFTPPLLEAGLDLITFVISKNFSLFLNFGLVDLDASPFLYIVNIVILY